MTSGTRISHPGQQAQRHKNHLDSTKTYNPTGPR
jgi:hypothetical protein